MGRILCSGSLSNFTKVTILFNGNSGDRRLIFNFPLVKLPLVHFINLSIFRTSKYLKCTFFADLPYKNTLPSKSGYRNINKR